MSSTFACYFRRKATSKGTNSLQTIFRVMSGQFPKQIVRCGEGWKVKHQNLAAEELMRLKLPQSRDKDAESKFRVSALSQVPVVPK